MRYCKNKICQDKRMQQTDSPKIRQEASNHKSAKMLLWPWSLTFWPQN